MKIDLHTHTKFSDGTYELKELLAEADRQNINVIAITDHDTVKAFEYLDKISHKYRVKVIKGVELTTVYRNEVIHLICLFKNNIIPTEILDYCLEQQRMRNARAVEMLNEAKKYGLIYDENILYSSTDVVNKHVIYNHLSTMNQISYDEIKKMLELGKYSSLKKLSFEEGIKLAKQTQSFCILAHPCLIKDQSILERFR